MKKNNVMIKRALSYIFSFFLFLFFFFAIFLAGLYFGAFNTHSIMNKVNESNYYNEVQRDLSNRVTEMVQESGLPDSVMDGVITLERVYVGGKYYMEDVLTGGEPVIKTDKLRSNLQQNIDNYLAEKKINISEEISNGIGELVSNVEGEYKRSIQFGFIKYVGEYNSVYKRVFFISMPILLLLTAIISFILIRLQRYIHRGVRYIASSLIASSCLTGLLAIYLLLNKIYDKSMIKPLYYGKFLTNYFRWDVQVYLYIAGLGLVFSMLLIVLSEYLKNHIPRNRK